MTMRKQRRGHPALALAVLAFVIAGTAIPIVIGSSGQRVTLESAGLHAATPDAYQIVAPVALPAAPQVRIERGIIALHGGPSPRPANGEAALQLLASGAARLALKDAVISVDMDARPKADAITHGDFGEEVAPLVVALLKSQFEAIALEGGTIRLRHSNGSATILENVTAEITHRRKTSLSAKGTFAAHGQRLAFETVLGLPSSGKMPARFPLKGTISGALVEAQLLDGRLTTGDVLSVQGQASLAVTNLRLAARWLGAAWPQGPGLDNFRAKGQLDWSNRGLSFQKANLLMDGNEANGTLSISMGTGRPSVEGTLAINSLDLSRHLKSDTAISSSAAMLERASGHDGTDLSLPLVRHLDADIRISANRVRLGAVELGRSALTLSVKGGKLLADIAEFEHDSARGSGQFSVDMNLDLPRFAARGKLNGFDLGRFASAAAGQQVLHGRGDVAIDLAGYGETMTQLVRTLEGKVSFEVNESARLGIDLNTLMIAPQRRTMEGWTFATRGQTPIEQLRGRFVTSLGSVTVEMMEATTAESIVTLTGSANLSQRTIEGAVRSARKLASDAVQSEPVSVKGPWSNPHFRATEAQRKAAEGAGGAATDSR